MTKAASTIRSRVSFAEYLELEDRATAKHEYHDGIIVAMAGGTLDHGTVATNISREVGNALKGKPCRAINSDVKLRVERFNRGYYPDGMIVCGPVEHPAGDTKRLSVLNPTVIIEVLSDSTAEFDRGEKFDHYRTVPALREYVLVSQDEARVQVFERRDDGTWVFNTCHGIDVMLRLNSVDVSVSLAEVYRDVTFDTVPAAEPID